MINNATDFYDDWRTVLIMITVIDVTAVILACWAFMSVIIYGTRTGRWTNRPGMSSLTCGKTYLLCIVAIFSIIWYLVTIELVNQHLRIAGGKDWCKPAVDLSVTSYFVSLYATYMFLWLLQRKIYQHPFVRGRVSRWMTSFSLIFALILAVTLIALVIVYNLLGKYKSTDGVCVINNDNNGNSNIIKISGSCGVAVLQVALIWSNVYSAICARFPSVLEDKTQHVVKGYNWKIFCRWFLPSKSNVFFGPVEKMVRRMVGYSLLIISAEITAVLLDSVTNSVTQSQPPLVIYSVFYGISSTVTVFAMISLFGFASKILSLCCPKRQRRQVSTIRVTSEPPSEDVTITDRL